MIRQSPRDKKLFELLARYEVMSSKQIRQIAYPDVIETNFFRRLRELEKEKVIKRLGPMLDHSYAWLLGSEGKRRIGFNDRDLFKTRLMLEHDVALTQVRLALDSIGVGKKLVPESELRRRARDQRIGYREKNKPVVVPDGLFPVLIKERAEVFALEVELTFKSKQRYFELFKRYLRMDGIYAIWYVVPNRSMGERILTEWESFFEKFDRQYSRSKILCYSVLDEFTTQPRTALIHGHQGQVKICDWWRLPPADFVSPSTDQSHDQRLISETNKNTEAA